MTTPVAPHIQEGIRLLNERLKPAKLDQKNLANANINATLLFQWLHNLGLNPMQLSARAIADNLESQIKKHVHEHSLIWEVEPKVLRQHVVEKIKTDQQYVEERNKQAQAVDASATKSKEDAAALQRINGMIEAVRITGMGRVQFAKTEAVQKALKDYLAQQVKAKTPLNVVEKKVRAEIARAYESYENGQSYSTTWGGA